MVRKLRDHLDDPESQLIEEIRVNPNYTSLVMSKYKRSQMGKSDPIIKKKTVFTKDYVKKLNEPKNIISGSLIPPNCRYIKSMSKEGFVVVIEEPPAFRTMFLNKPLDKELRRLRDAGKLSEYNIPEDYLKGKRKPYHLNLAIPYTIFIMWITEYYGAGWTEVYFRTSQMKGLSDNLLRAPFLNIPEEQRICFRPPTTNISLVAAIQDTIRSFWQEEFNLDYSYNYTSYRGVPVLGNYLEWEAMSKINPMFIYSADWLPMPYNINQRINHFIHHTSGRRTSEEIGYEQLKQLFYLRRDSEVEEKPSPRSSRRYRLYYDITNGIYLNRSLHIEVGDTFTNHDGKPVFIDSFAGFADGSEVKYIQVDINGNKHLLKFTRACKNFLLKKINDERFTDKFELPSGETIKSGDIIVIKTHTGSEIYRKVNYIRKGRGIEGNDHEIRVGSNFYLGSRLVAKKFDTDNPEYRGVKLDSESEYIVIPPGRRQYGITMIGHRCKYLELDVSNNDLIAKFSNILPDLSGITHSITFSEESSGQGVYPAEKARSLNGIVKVGRKIYTTSRTGRNLYKNAMWQVGSKLVYDSHYIINGFRVHQYIDKLYDDDHFHIDGVDFDINFNIGDKVVVADWSDPLSVLSVKTIQGFKQEGDSFSFILVDKNEKLSTIQYISPNHIINAGKIRKVTNKYKKLSVGTKIIANEAGIANFPKKDVNIIVAFIVDIPGEPMVLCSNGCTLWYNDVIEKFTKITMKSKEWEKLQHAPLDLSKIKFQAGDIVNGMSDFREDGGYLLYYPASTRSLRAIPMNALPHSDETDDSYPADKYFLNDMIFDCIPAPRVTTTKNENDIVKGYININSYQVEEDQNSFLTFLKPKE